MRRLILFLIVWIFHISSSHKCRHDLFMNRTLINVDSQVQTRPYLLSSESETHSYDIYIDYDSINVWGSGNNQLISKIKTALGYVSEAFSKILSVSQNVHFKFEDDTILKKCDSSIITSSTLKNGVVADMVIIPLIVPQEQLGENVIAAAGACAFANKLNNRPAVGVVYLGSKISFDKDNSMVYASHILLHELTHALVFSPILFSYFPSQHEYKNVIWQGQKKTLVITPKVVEVARKHYGCDTLEGVELEDQGGQGSALAHWESRIMLGDYMISTDFQERAISEITLALFEDSGWYQVNYNLTGGLFRFGKNEGCQFLENLCIINEQSYFPREFCTESRANRCMTGHTSKGFCYLVSGLDIPIQYRYFTDPSKGGFPAADYCPVVVPTTISSTTSYFGSHCKHGENNTLPQSLGDYLGSNSVCIESSLTKKDDITVSEYKGKITPKCHQIECNYETNSFSINVTNINFVCDQKGKILTHSDFDGQLACPDFERVCPESKNFCNELFDCLGIPISSSFYKINIVILSVITLFLFGS